MHFSFTIQNSLELKLILKFSILSARRVNDQLMQLERHFVDPHGLPNRPEYKLIVNLFNKSMEDNTNNDFTIAQSHRVRTELE